MTAPFVTENTTTLSTPQGSIIWSKSPDGTIQAEGGGQKVIVSAQYETDGSGHSQADYSPTGSAPYLSSDLVWNVSSRQVAFTLKAGSSQLTLTVANIDALVKSGTATLSGTWNGTAVHWTAQADLTSNPLVSRPIAGWPAGAFASELQKAAFFAPLGNALGRNNVAQRNGTTGSDGTHHVLSVGGVFGRAGAWCEWGAMGGAVVGPETLGTSLLVGCAAGAGGSFFGDFETWVFDRDPSPTPPVWSNPPDLPPDYPPQGSSQTVSQDDPPPPPIESSGSGGTGRNPADDGDPTHEDE
jgi:hypothetical protein